MMFKFISFHTYCFHFFYAERVVLYTALYQYIHVRTITYARTTHTHDVSQDLTHVISFQFNHHPLVHTNLANCIALFALFFNISKPTKQKLALSAKTFYLLTFLSQVKRSTFLSPLSLSRSTFLSPVRQHKHKQVFVSCVC